jgi:hypothetical protein
VTARGVGSESESAAQVVNADRATLAGFLCHPQQNVELDHHAVVIALASPRTVLNVAVFRAALEDSRETEKQLAV